jgi:hypothetical protein
MDVASGGAHGYHAARLMIRHGYVHGADMWYHTAYARQRA